MSSLRTARLTAEPVGMHDLAFFVALWSDPLVAPPLGGPRDAGDVEQALRQSVEHWRTEGFGRWLLRRDGVAIGNVKLARCVLLGRSEVELGYALVPAAWGQGLATEAGAAALGYARDVVGLPDVVAYARTDNAASLAVMDRLGFVPEAELDVPPNGRHFLRRRMLAHHRDG